MADAWGGSWGTPSAWGVSWGTPDAAAPTAHRTNDGAWMPRPRIIRESRADIWWARQRKIMASLMVLLDGR